MSEDWESVTYLRKKTPKKSELKTKKAVTEAQRKGGDVETNKKCTKNKCRTILNDVTLWTHLVAAGSNKQRSTTKDTAKLDRETEELHHEKVELDLSKLIQRIRLDKKMTQKDLAQKINEKPSIITEYETGKAIPNNQLLGKMERALGVKLRGKDKGKPL
ncbi:Endothelial differentiation-related factor 1 [Trichoplax sp. H2]|nr:Endothelial differentiation-related factor 1 [Trichoplax sp. H2]|eukprot:RDD44396.1 Endothelial differentiation-related factor 1 [Trichoplax sp. H2]